MNDLLKLRLEIASSVLSYYLKNDKAFLHDKKIAAAESLEMADEIIIQAAKTKKEFEDKFNQLQVKWN